MAQQVFPTKSNLMATKRSLALATQGYDLMDRKRNILVREMMQLIDRAAGIQDRISAAYAEAYEALKKANIMLGSVGGYAAGVPVERGVQMSTRSVMGVELPTLRLNTTSPMGLYYDLESTNGTLDVAYLKFNEVKTLTVELAEVETSVIRLAEALIHILEEHMGEKESAAESIEVIDIAHDQEYESLHVEQLKEHTRAYIKVQDGCNQFCSYCIIPYARGRVRSRKMEEVLEEITNLTKHGCQEFVITGIHVTSYGKDLGDVTLIDLLEEIAKIPEVKRIRLGSLEPGFITKDTLDRLSKMESFCPHFHLSLQSGCDSVLKRMNRKYTTQDIREKCKAIREHFQYPALTTDIIVGFPGETEEEFEATRKFLEEIDLYEMHVFKYSIRKGTKAADMKPQINDQIKAKRSNVLLEMSKQHQKEFETKQLGMVKEVLIEEKMHGKDHYYTGHTKEYIKVALYSEEPLENKIVKVKLRQILDDGYVLAEC